LITLLHLCITRSFCLLWWRPILSRSKALHSSKATSLLCELDHTHRLSLAGVLALPAMRAMSIELPLLNRRVPRVGGRVPPRAVPASVLSAACKKSSISFATSSTLSTNCLMIKVNVSIQFIVCLDFVLLLRCK
jgi:hypothetical protein